MYEQQEPDTDPTKVRATDDRAEVEAHLRRDPRLNDEMDDEPDVEGHMRRRDAAQPRARRR